MCTNDSQLLKIDRAKCKADVLLLLQCCSRSERTNEQFGNVSEIENELLGPVKKKKFLKLLF